MRVFMHLIYSFSKHFVNLTVIKALYQTLWDQRWLHSQRRQLSFMSLQSMLPSLGWGESFPSGPSIPLGKHSPEQVMTSL